MIKKSISGQCKEAGISRATYYIRLGKGQAPEEAIKKKPSITQRCKEAGISRATYYAALDRGMSPDEIFEQCGWLNRKCKAAGVSRETYRKLEEIEALQKDALDRMGVRGSLKRVHGAYGIQPSTYYKRISAGMSKEEALTKPVEDDGRNGHESVEEFCRRAGISAATYWKYKQAGYSKDDILHGRTVDKRRNVTYGGKSLVEICREAGISKATYYYRTRKIGMSHEAALRAKTKK